jgi:hypothetical protein
MFSDVEYSLIILTLLFLGFGYMLRKKISYFYCPLEKYTGKIYKGKAYYFYMPHLLLSFGLCVLSFISISDLQLIDKLFENNLFRISSFILIWFIWILFLGLIIEAYLIKTDTEYRDWKDKYLNGSKN